LERQVDFRTNHSLKSVSIGEEEIYTKRSFLVAGRAVVLLANRTARRGVPRFAWLAVELLRRFGDHVFRDKTSRVARYVGIGTEHGVIPSSTSCAAVLPVEEDFCSALQSRRISQRSACCVRPYPHFMSCHFREAPFSGALSPFHCTIKFIPFFRVSMRTWIRHSTLAAQFQILESYFQQIQ
jgi:hypothetical protein